MDWEKIFSLVEVKDWDAFCADFFPCGLQHLESILSSVYERDETREVFLNILYRLLEEGRMVHPKPGSTMNEVRDSPVRPMPMWNAPPAVMVDCYRLGWPPLEHLKYIYEIFIYCYDMEFAWVAWDRQLLTDRGLQEDYRPGGLWYDCYEYAEAGEWALLPRNEDAAPVVSLALQRHLRRLGFDSVDA
ncbi:hypothetical protein, partial [Acidithiobacillus sp.]|uniref:hypothetical protein n=1 Tax=Acidithiobacillus sp. TaxID=1872118 RepID=UPI0025B9CED5